MGEEDTPRVAEPVVEVNGSLSGLSLEVWCDGSESEGRHLGLRKEMVENWIVKCELLGPEQWSQDIFSGY